ncbi:dihydrofolate reductase [Paenimyroides baculatum]|uniref:Dihydrofolate reductase n=1 Tax=Paenimyroides baculatum TaxID=2608000 RepID=A0A5M6CLY8_9FLAO|nr:dihydrofolate reductase [Paenimyroides baculatum]KAA5535440.1 dihydrofolate reductase [Paenimyroides baculatum]
MKISLVAAIAQNKAIGKDNDLLWHLPADFKHFKETTSGHFILMGRKTFKSFPKPLPNRTHLIITRQKNYNVPDDCFAFASVSDALQFAKQQNQETVYVIGGGEIYKETISVANELVITHVNAVFEDADAFFPEIASDWKMISEEFHKSDEKNKFDFTIKIYQK